MDEVRKAILLRNALTRAAVTERVVTWEISEAIDAAKKGMKVVIN